MTDALIRNKFCQAPCASHPWRALDDALMRALETESPATIFELIDGTAVSYHWPSVLQRDDASKMNKPRDFVFFNLSIFNSLHRWVCRLLLDEPHNEKAKAFLQVRLGSCHELLLKALRRILVAEMFTDTTTGTATDDSNYDDLTRLDEMEIIGNFLNRFMHCLGPVRMNRTTNSLVRRVQTALTDKQEQQEKNKRNNNEYNGSDGIISPEQHSQIDHIVSFLKSFMTLWHSTHDLSPQERWESFRDAWLGESSSGRKHTVGPETSQRQQKVSKGLL